MLICLSASHNTADFDTLEALATVDSEAVTALLRSHPGVNGAVVIGTCNRFEAYLDVADDRGPATATEALACALGRSGVRVASPAHPLTDAAAAEHLFAVAAGLESVVVGEGEIAGQVRRSLKSAQRCGTTSPDLERLFQRASETQRAVKQRTGLGESGRSLVRLSLDLAADRVADWSMIRVLLVGTGNYAAATVAALRDRGVRDIEVWSPSGRGRKFAHTRGLVNVDGRDMPIAAAAADLIITCTSAADHVIDAATLRAGRRALAATHAIHLPVEPETPAAGRCPVSAGAQGASRCPVAAESAVCGGEATCPVEHGRASQLVIDLGLPRNVDPDVGTVHGVALLDLETIRLHAPHEHLTASEDARDLVRKAARTFARVSEENKLTPAVVALREHVQEALEAELTRVRKRGTSAEQAVAEQALRHFAGVLLHKPSVRARELAASGRHDDYLDALEALFGIDTVA